MNSQKYSNVVHQAFARLGFEPRDGQAQVVCDILFEYLDNGMQNVIICAPTGTGKSLIGAAAAEALSLARSSADGPKSSIMLCSSNVLAKQYDTSFSALAKEDKYIMIKGAGNYPCTALTTPEEPQSAEACAWYTMTQAGSEFEGVMAEHCNKCEFRQIKRKKNTVRHLTTNYSYFFIDRMYTGKFEDRDLVIWDEAHLVNDLFSEHNAIHFSQKRIQAMQKEIAETVHLTDPEIAKIMKGVAADCAKPGKITEKNFEIYLNSLTKVYRYAKDQADALSDRALRSGKMGVYSKLTKFSKKYEGLACKIDDLAKYNYPHVFEYKEDEAAVSIKPVFVGSMMEALKAGTNNLFMSATITSGFMTKTLDLDPSKTKFIKLPSTFPKENKEVVFFDPISLSYQSLQNPATVKQLRSNVAKIVKHHIDGGDRGIILSPSFKLQNEIVAELTSAKWAKQYKLFEHRQGEKLESVLTAFKSYSAGPAVLISPAMFEGVDLPGALSRFQIMVKAPFPSLGDKRIKWILDHHPDLYNTLTIMKMVQGFGRSVRSAEDHAISYCLDQNGSRLWSGNHNLWRDEFNTRYSKFL